MTCRRTALGALAAAWLPLPARAPARRGQEDCVSPSTPQQFAAVVAKEANIKAQ